MEYLWLCIVAIAIVIFFFVRKSNRELKEERALEEPNLKAARIMHTADFGTYSDESTELKDTKIETPVGTFIRHRDGTYSDLTNNLMWIQAPWGTKWNGNKFTGEPIKLDWNSAIELFGYGGMQTKATNLKKEDIDAHAHGSQKYKRGSCMVTFAGHSDWRLPTSKEILTLSLYDKEEHFQDSGYHYFSDSKTKELRKQLFPDFHDFPDFPNLWCANDNGRYGWQSGGGDSLGDEQKNTKRTVVFVRSLYS